MDRNITSRQFPTTKPPVALRKESVDRNKRIKLKLNLINEVALRKESVDRNGAKADSVSKWTASLSARRAWIEIVYPGTWSGSILSLSARRAWIEIFAPADLSWGVYVALRKESVDRNTMRRDFKCLGLRRSPQGERG